MTSAAAKKAWESRRRHSHASKQTRRTHAGKKGQKKKWMGQSVKRPGALTAKIEKRYGKEGFDAKGRIKISVLEAMKANPKTDTLTGQQVQFRLNTRGVHR
jgi:hypothetical protein